MNFREKSILNVLIAFLLVGFATTSCKTTKIYSAYDIKPLSTSKIIKKVEKESPIYKSYESKRVSFEFETDKIKNSFSGQITILKNDRILLSAKKMAIPLGKAMITRDSLKLVNYFEKNYIADDVSTLQKLFGVELDFDLLQALITADVSNLLQNEEFDKELTAYIDSNMYRIDSEFDSKIDRALNKGKEKRLNRYMKQMDAKEFTDYTVWIDPQFFVIRKVIFNNIKNKQSLTLNFNQFELVGRSLFPQNISFEQYSPNQNLKVELKISKPTVNDVKDFNFVIPDKFEKYNLPRK